MTDDGFGGKVHESAGGTAAIVPGVVPKCAVCGALITNGYHDCTPPMSRTSVPPLGGIHLTPWGTWEWRPF